MAERVTQSLAPGNMARIRARRDEMTQAKGRTVTIDEALEAMLDESDAYRRLEAAS
jgi:hypothetical protein